MSIKSLDRTELATYLVGQAICKCMAKAQTHPSETLNQARSVIYLILGTNLPPDEFSAIHGAFDWLEGYEEHLREAVRTVVGRKDRERS